MLSRIQHFHSFVKSGSEAPDPWVPSELLEVSCCTSRSTNAKKCLQNHHLYKYQYHIILCELIYIILYNSVYIYISRIYIYIMNVISSCIQKHELKKWNSVHWELNQLNWCLTIPKGTCSDLEPFFILPCVFCQHLVSHCNGPTTRVSEKFCFGMIWLWQDTATIDGSPLIPFLLKWSNI